MENTEAVGSTAAASAAQLTNLSNLNNYYDAISNTPTITNLGEWSQSNPITWTTISSSNTDADLKLEEIKEHLEGSLEAVNNKINSILDLIKENDDSVDTYNNMLQYLIGQKQTIIDIQKLFK